LKKCLVDIEGGGPGLGASDGAQQVTALSSWVGCGHALRCGVARGEMTSATGVCEAPTDLVLSVAVSETPHSVCRE
jgi:hypothetical protein